MWIKDLIWDDHNVEHIAYHHVEPGEAEEAVWGDAWFKRGPGRQRCYAYSRTEAGRYLFIVLDREYNECFYVVTVRDMNEDEKRLYQRGRGR